MAANMTDLELAAYHEAAHFVAWHRLDTRFNLDHLTVVAGRGGGQFLFTNYNAPANSDEARKFVKILLAGYVTEIRLEPQHEERAKKSADDDCKKARPVIEEFNLGQDEIEAETKHLIVRHWNEVERLARWLVKHGLLCRRAAKLVCDGREDLVDNDDCFVGPQYPDDRDRWSKTLRDHEEQKREYGRDS